MKVSELKTKYLCINGGNDDETVKMEDTSGVRSGHASHALHDQIFKNCITNFCVIRWIFLNW